MMLNERVQTRPNISIDLDLVCDPLVSQPESGPRWIERLISDSPGFDLSDRREGSATFAWTTLDRTGTRKPVAVRICMRTGELACSRAFTHWSDMPVLSSHVVVVPDLMTFLTLERAIGRENIFPFVLVVKVAGDSPIPDWSDDRYWNFASITILAERSATAVPLSETRNIDAGIARPPSGASWRLWAECLERIDTDCLSAIQASAVALDAFHLISTDDPDPIGWTRRRCRTLDAEHRLCRPATLMRDVAGAAVPTARHVVVRSDRSFAEIASSRPRRPLQSATAIGLGSGGTRVDRWDTASVVAYLDAGRAASSVTVANALMSAFGPLVGGHEETARVLAAYVGLTYVFPAVDNLPLLFVRGGSSATRFAVRRQLAGICHDPTVVSRTRARHLARVTDAGSGVLLLNEPGPSCGPSGPTELGRFLESGLVRDASSYNAVSTRFGLRTLDIFGPKVVLGSTGTASELTCDVAVVDLPDVSGAEQYVLDAVAGAAVRDALYGWSMHAFARLRESVGAAAGGTVLRAVLDDLFDDLPRTPTLAERPPVSPGVPPVDGTSVSPARLMANILSSVGNGSHLSMIQVMLEIALRGGDATELSPERVGRWLSAHPQIANGGAVERRRLYGQISRIYPLASDADPVADVKSAFDFCVGSECQSCRYDGVCSTTFAGLRERKQAI